MQPIPPCVLIAYMADYRRLAKQQVVTIYACVLKPSTAFFPTQYSLCDGASQVTVYFESGVPRDLEYFCYYRIEVLLSYAPRYVVQRLERVAGHDELHTAYVQCLDCLRYLTDLNERQIRVQLTGFTGVPAEGDISEERVLMALRIFGRANIMILALYLQVTSIVTDLDPTLARLVAAGKVIYNRDTGYFTLNEESGG
jgi:hypothetical protein